MDGRSTFELKFVNKLIFLYQGVHCGDYNKVDELIVCLNQLKHTAIYCYIHTIHLMVNLLSVFLIV